MKRDEAKALVGSRVSVWTASNGTYTGTLTEVTEDRPWRGKVLIDGVLSPAACHGVTPFRRGYRVGQEIEAGGSSIEPTDRHGVTDYVSLLDAQADAFEDHHGRYLAGEFGDPAVPNVSKWYQWMDRAAKQVREAAERIRREENQHGQGTEPEGGETPRP